MIDATVKEVSADAENSASDVETYKKFRMILTPSGKDTVDVFGEEVPLAVGMNVSAEIKIKEKRIVDFFLDPFRQYTSEALRER